MEFNPNQQTEVPLAHYRKQFASDDPNAMAGRSNVSFDGEHFSLKYMGRPVTISWPGAEVMFLDNDQEVSDYSKILLLRLITEGTLAPSMGKMVAYADMPWGEVYSRQFNGRCILRLAGSYGKNIDGFKKGCESLKGKKVDFGDIAYDIPFLDGLTVRLIIWESDDEFPATAQILFSDNFPAAFSAEDIAEAGTLLINAMKGRW